ncbi:MAG TPA: tetraacyldisaccharide 4'-kinase, partial [Flavobacterium sp.]|nr:tetraacyldisaccharide 4'-kinase [Flavobacterium sp.]
MIVVTKCPATLSLDEQNEIKAKLKLESSQELYFSFVDYAELVYSDDKTMKVSEIRNVDKLLLAGIAKPNPFFAYLHSENDEILVFPDHHHFTENDINDIKNKSQNKIIITTEKDFVRLKDSIPSRQLYYLPIRSSFLSASDNFDKTITNYVGTSTRNS